MTAEHSHSDDLYRPFTCGGCLSMTYRALLKGATRTMTEPMERRPDFDSWEDMIENQHMIADDAPADRPTTEPRTEAGRRIVKEWLMLRPDYPANTARVRDMVLEAEAEAAQGAAPGDYHRDRVARERQDPEYDAEYRATRIEGAAPRAEGLDYGEIWARWEEFADMAARSGSGFTQDQITGAAAMLTWLIDHEDRSIR